MACVFGKKSGDWERHPGIFLIQEPGRAPRNISHLGTGNGTQEYFSSGNREGHPGIFHKIFPIYPLYISLDSRMIAQISKKHEEK